MSSAWRAGTVRVVRQFTELVGQPPQFGPPKSYAGKRVVSVPSMILPDVVSHLADRTAPGAASLVFANRNGQPLAHSHFRGRVWLPALTSAGLTDVHFHDLRHAGNHLVAEAGANLRELMERMGHSSSRAALIYLHSTNDRQRALADAVAERAQAELKTGSRGTSVARPGETAAP